jgi:hypothetical protein
LGHFNYTGIAAKLEETRRRPGNVTRGEVTRGCSSASHFAQESQKLRIHDEEYSSGFLQIEESHKVEILVRIYFTKEKQEREKELLSHAGNGSEDSKWWFFFVVVVVLGFELRAFTLNHSTSPIFVTGFFKIGFHELLFQAGF